MTQDHALVLGYLGLIVVMASLVLWIRALARGPRFVGPAQPRSVPPEELAFLAGGPERAALEAVIGLVDAGVLRVVDRGEELTAAGALPAGAHPMQAL